MPEVHDEPLNVDNSVEIQPTKTDRSLKAEEKIEENAPPTEVVVEEEEEEEEYDDNHHYH